MTKEILLKALELMAKELADDVNCAGAVCPCLSCGCPECIKAIVDKYICMAMEAK